MPFIFAIPFARPPYRATLAVFPDCYFPGNRARHPTRSESARRTVKWQQQDHSIDRELYKNCRKRNHSSGGNPHADSGKGFTRKDLKQQTINELKEKRSEMDLKISDSKKKLKAQSSFDSDHWVRRTDIAEKEVEGAILQKRISVRDFMKTGGGTEQGWVKTPNARKLFEQDKTYASEQKIYSRQAEKLKNVP